MVDGNRVYPVDYFFLHHSVGSDFKDAEDIEVQDWYSNIGKARGYGNGAINPHHEHPSRPGQLTYAMAQFTLREYTKDGNKYGWRLTDLIKNPWANVAWAVGNWHYNQRSCSVEVCGDYRNKVLPDKALMCLADFLRGIDQELINAGHSGGINVWLHSEVFSTECPARIREQRDKVVDMINNPDKWNAVLFPPQPTVVTKEEIVTETIPFSTEKTPHDRLPVGQTKVIVEGETGVKTITYAVTYTNGKETSRTLKSEAVTKPPVNEVIAVGTSVEPVPPTDPTPETNTPDTRSWVELLRELLKRLLDWVTGK